MSEKSCVTVESSICPVCTKKHDVGVLFDTRMRDIFPGRSITTHFELCDEHKKKFDEGFVAVIGIDPEKSEQLPDGNFTLETVYRIGRFALLKNDLASTIFNKVAPKNKIIFCDADVLDYLEGLHKEAEESEDES